MKGNISITNLEVKKTLLKEFNIPFAIRSGKIKQINAKISLAKIGTDPTEVNIDGISLTICKIKNFNRQPNKT